MDKKLKSVLTLAFAIVFVGVGGFFLVREANASTPVDALFPLDKFAESVTRLAIINPEAEIAFETKVLEERLAELDALTAESEDTTKALEEIDAQVKTLDTTVADGDSKLTLQQREELRLQYQEKIQLHIQTMEKVQEQVGNDTAQQSIQKSIDRLDTKLTESKNVELEANKEENSESNSGEDTQIQNQNQESNSDDTSNGSGSESGSGSSNTNGKGN